MGNQIAVLAGFVTMCAGSLCLYNDYKKKNIQSIKNIRPNMKASIEGKVRCSGNNVYEKTITHTVVK